MEGRRGARGGDGAPRGIRERGAGTAEADARAPAADSRPYKVGIVYSRTGLLAAYGAEYIQGLRYGLAYATKGTMTGQRPQDRADDRRRRHRSDEGRRGRQGPDRQGLQDPRRQRLVRRRAPDGAARRAEQGALHLRPGRVGRDHRHQQVHVPLRPPDLPGRARPRRRSSKGVGKKVDRLRAGLRLRRSATTRPSTRSSASQGHKVGRMLVPLSAQDFTPFAQQVKQANPDLLFVAWAGTTAPAMWRALEQQGVFGVSNKITTGLAERATWSTFGDVGSEDRLPLALRLHGAEEQGERLPRQARCGSAARCPTCSRRTASSPAR